MFKKYLTIFLAFWICTLDCNAQDSVGIKKYFRRLVKLINDDNLLELANLVQYPLHRANPIPNISSTQEFIAYAPLLFDAAFKIKLSSYKDSDIFEHHFLYGLVGGKFNGDIWINDDGKIVAINTHSAKEEALQQRLTKEIQNRIYQTVKEWKRNLIVCETDKFLIRVDIMEDDEFRYVSWSKPKKINDKPDLIVFKGVQDFQGTMGGVSYTFKNDGYYYQIDQRDMAESDDDVGLFLKLYKTKEDLENEKVFIRYKCHEVK
jgi:hypothetical protein